MKTILSAKISIFLVLVVAPAFARGQAVYTDDFSKPHSYLSNGVAGTIWDGIYLGANEFSNPSSNGMAPSTISVADAGITSNGMLTVASLQTDWEGLSDDGFFLFKVVSGDFDMSVQVVGPIDTRAHHFPGLMVRAFGPGGAPAPDGKENYFVWARFDEYQIANMLKNNVNGVKRDRGLGKYPNTNYWLRVTRTGNVFHLFEKGSAVDVWNDVGSVTRTNFGSGPLQIGIEHADYDGGRTLRASYKNFSLTVSNLGPLVAELSPATDLKVSPNSGGQDLEISWSPGAGSSGSLVTLRTGNPVLKEAPASGITYQGNAAPGNPDTLASLPDWLPGTNYSVIYAGPGATAKAHVMGAPPFHLAVFSYAGSGASITYSHDAPQAEAGK